MGAFVAIVVIGLVMWFFYTKKKQGLTPNEALKEVINGKPKDKTKVIAELEVKKKKLAEEAKQVEQIKQLKSEIKAEQERISKAKE